MKVYQGIVLGFVQGLTEFLPVSSSGHLILTEKLLGVSGGLFFSLLLHSGTLFSVLVVKFKAVKKIDRKRAVRLIIATVPAGIIGVFLGDVIDGLFFGGRFLPFGFLFTAVYLYVAEKRYNEKSKQITLKDSLYLGLAQGVAVIPAVSRSGTVFATGELLGIEKNELADFTFLMSIPVIGGGIFYETLKCAVKGGFGEIAVAPTLFGCLSAFVGGIIAVYFVDFAYTKGKTKYFAVYLLLLSVILTVL